MNQIWKFDPPNEILVVTIVDSIIGYFKVQEKKQSILQRLKKREQS